MKHKSKVLVILMLCFLSFGKFAIAAFPVETSNISKETVATSANKVVSKSDIKVISKSSEINSITSSTGGDDDLLITLLLWFFLGGLAAHRWYKKKPVGWNILFILTAGGCGIWAIVDLINIIKGNF